MKDFLKEIYYYFLYGSIIGRCDSRYRKLDILKIYLEEVGMKAVSKIVSSTSLYDYYIIFNDDTTLYISYSTDYTFMRRGIMKFSDKELKWNEGMPSYEILYRYRKIIKKYHKDIDSDYSEYLPLTLKRKLKLKKLK